MTWPTIEMNWDSVHKDFCDCDPIFSTQAQAQQSPQVPLGYYWETSECANSLSSLTESAVLNTQTMPSTSDYLDWGMPSATNLAGAVSTSFGSPTPRVGPSHYPGATQCFFSHPVGISPEGQSVDLASQTPEGNTCKDEVYHRECTMKPNARAQNTLKRSKRAQKSQDLPWAQSMKCEWDGCHYSGTFERESSLIRHLRTIHFSPGAHPCPVPGCDMVCNRADNLTQHMRNVHN